MGALPDTMAIDLGLLDRAVVCLTTHDRTDCARINQEIIKLNYRRPLRIVHACSSRGYAKCREDLLLACEPRPLKEGALNLLRTAIDGAVHEFNPDFIIHLEADTWILDETVLARYVESLAADPSKVLAASSWSADAYDFSLCTGQPRPGRGGAWDRARMFAAERLRTIGLQVGIRDRDTYATQFFVLRNEPAAVDAVLAMKAERGRGLEASLYAALHGPFSLDQVVPMPEREPVEPRHRYWCDALHLYCQHWPAAGTAEDPRSPASPLYVPPSAAGKRESLLQRSARWEGEHLNRLLQARNTDYYNSGAKRY